MDEMTDERHQRRIVVEVGLESMPPGFTRVEVSGGTIHLVHRLMGREKQIEAVIEDEGALQVFQNLSLPLNTRLLKLAIPDEAIYQVQIYENDLLTDKVMVWRSGLPADSQLETLITTLQRVVNECSEGKVILS
jgi:xanthine/CO dehydrogenase XdhC/CoxF family maturation factor